MNEGMSAQAHVWGEPRRVDEWFWLDLNEWDGARLLRCGRVSWNADGTGAFEVSITVESHNGLGLYCWPAFRALSDAQDFVETLMPLSVMELYKRHGKGWQKVW